MLITTSTPYISATAASGALSPANVRKTDNAFAALFTDDSPEDMIHKITENGVEGMMKWKIDEMKKEAAKQALAARNLTLDQVAAMPTAERITLENQILDEVAQKVKEAMNEQMKRERHVGELDTYDAPSLAQGIDILA